MEELINDFIAETRDMLEALGGEIVAWEAEPHDRARLDEIFRFVHTLKGNCGFFDLPRLEALSHAAEDALAEVRSRKRDPDRALVSGVLAIIDRIAELVQALESGEAVATGDDSALIDALQPADQPAQPSDVSGPAFAGRKPARTIRLSIDVLDRMMSGVSDMVLARNELARRLRDTACDISLQETFERLSQSIAEVRDGIMRTRMQRADTLFLSLPRMVRDLSGELGKQVRLEVEGGDVELDREMLEMIRDPLTHLVRNAVDHGIEPPEERIGAGKAAAGRLRISARQSGNQIVIEVADDGRGIDGDKLVRKALAAGLLSEAEAARLPDARKTALVFEPGLSTASEVTAISGRGVGMDVVRANIERIGGTVDIESRPSRGTKLALRVPLTLTIIPALTVSAGGIACAIPRSVIQEIFRSTSDSVRVDSVGGSPVASVRGRRMPLVKLPGLLGRPESGDPAARRIVVLKPAGGEPYALEVDSVGDHEELVIRPASPQIMAAGLYAGVTLSEDGSPILLLDASGIASVTCAAREERTAEIDEEGGRSEQLEGAPALLFRTLGGGKRAVALTVVQRIDEVAASAIRRTGGRLRVAIGDALLPLAGCDTAPSSGSLRILRLSDGTAEIGYAMAEVIDLISLGQQIQPSAEPGEISGVTLVAGDQVELIDPFWLFAQLSRSAETGARKPVCAIPAGDPWFHTILRPLVESAGYEVIEAGGDVGWDVMIASAEAPAALPKQGRLIRLRTSPEPVEDDGSIYRYDRDALLSALSLRAGRS